MCTCDCSCVCMRVCACVKHVCVRAWKQQDRLEQDVLQQDLLHCKKQQEKLLIDQRIMRLYERNVLQLTAFSASIEEVKIDRKNTKDNIAPIIGQEFPVRRLLLVPDFARLLPRAKKYWKTAHTFDTRIRMCVTCAYMWHAWHTRVTHSHTCDTHIHTCDTHIHTCHTNTHIWHTYTHTRDTYTHTWYTYARVSTHT